MNPNELLSSSRIRCQQCGYRTLQKARLSRIKRIKAR
ncbi:MAG: hypothetical protein INQ03_18005 [Candidatus Heimdallarchaeota archaeon]|nr:hypothetical protein [Candidatus Heimdallarchaeota archaeon]